MHSNIVLPKNLFAGKFLSNSLKRQNFIKCHFINCFSHLTINEKMFKNSNNRYKAVKL